MAKTIGWHHPVDESDQWDGFNDSGIEHFRGSPIPHLAREMNQNALDAGRGGSVSVRFTLQNVSTKTIPGLDELKQNLQACATAASGESRKAEIFFGRALAELAKPKISVLEISDYNTTGMPGPSENGTPFYAFMKARGQSRKGSDTATGSYGIGKFAPYAVSNLRTIFVSTVYEDPNGGYRQLTQGKSILMSHDIDGARRQGVGFWGIRDKCQPIDGVSRSLPKWVQRATTKKELPDNRGSKISVLCFEGTKNWPDLLAVSVAENFFGAINGGKLRVEIGEEHVLDESTIRPFFDSQAIKKLLANQKNEPEQFEYCGHYLAALSDTTEVIVEESEMRELGLVQVRILIAEGLPKKVCALRNGMFITDSLSGLRVFSDFKEFVAVVQCQSTKGNELLRAMEPPRHDDFEPDRLPTKEDQKRGARALKDLARWIRDMLKRHAKEPVSSVTEIDELRDFFGDEGEEGSGKGVEEVNPYGDVIVRAKPLKPKAAASAQTDEAGAGGEGDTDDGGGGKDGAGGGDGAGGEGDGAGGASGPAATKSSVGVTNVRAISSGPASRRVSFTPEASGKICLRLLESGADQDYAVSIVNADKGRVENGALLVDVLRGQRLTLAVDLGQEFAGAVKVVANEI